MHPAFRIGFLESTGGERSYRVRRPAGKRRDTRSTCRLLKFCSRDDFIVYTRTKEKQGISIDPGTCAARLQYDTIPSPSIAPPFLSLPYLRTFSLSEGPERRDAARRLSASDVRADGYIGGAIESFDDYSSCRLIFPRRASRLERNAVIAAFSKYLSWRRISLLFKDRNRTVRKERLL